MIFASITGTSVSKLSDFAVDDEGDVIKYSVDTVGQSYCNIDSASGLITLAKPLDREVSSSAKLNHSLIHREKFAEC